MNILRRCLRWTLLLVSIAFLLSMSSISVATAQDALETEITLSAPSSASLGDVIQVKTNLQDETGAPVSGVTAHFFSYAEFLSGSAGLIEIGEAVTDGEGVATLEFMPRRGGNIEVVAKYDGDNSYAPSEASISFTVEGNEQLFEAHAGFSVPFINKWLLVGVMSILWGTILFVGFLVVRIAFAPPE